MSCCKVANHGTLPASVLMEIVIEHNEDLVCVEILTARINYSQAVSVSVNGNSEIVALADNSLYQRSKLLI